MDRVKNLPNVATPANPKHSIQRPYTKEKINGKTSWGRFTS